MMKQKLSPVKYETAFVPPNYIYFRQEKKQQSSFEHSITSRIGDTANKNKQSKYGKLYFIEHCSDYLSIWIFSLNSYTNPLYSRPF